MSEAFSEIMFSILMCKKEGNIFCHVLYIEQVYFPLNHIFKSNHHC